MTISYSKQFLKQAKKLEPKVRGKVVEKIRLFSEYPLHADLRNHQLKGKFKAYRSIDISGDYRALYLQRDSEVVFDMIWHP